MLLHLPLQYLVLKLALVDIIYIVITGIIKIIYSISKFWTNDLNVINSPFNQLASLSTKLLYCWKRGCQVGSTCIGLTGAYVITDTILEAGGQEKNLTLL